MAWNYRVLQYSSSDSEEGLYKITEVYYDEQGNPTSWVDEPIDPLSAQESKESLQWIMLALQEAITKPVLMVVDGKLVEVSAYDQMP